MVISQSLLKPYMSAEERPFAIDSISIKGSYAVIEG